MGRIRTIKPEFPQSETVGRLSRDARLLFIQIWTIVDDSGRARGASRMLASLLYPYDDDAPGLIDGWMGELEREGCIRRYMVSGTSYLDIPHWQQHQKVDRPTPSKIPAFDEGSMHPREDSRDLVEPSSTDLGPWTLDLGSGKGEGAGEGNSAVAPAPSPDEPTLLAEDAGDHPALTPQPKAAKAKPERKAGSRLPDDWRLSPENRAYAVGEGFSDWEADRVALRFADYWRARPGQGGVKLDWSATWRNWVRTEADRQGKVPKAAAPSSPQPLPVRDIHDPAYRGARPAQRRDVDLTPEQEAARQARAASLRAAAERIDAARASKAGGAH